LANFYLRLDFANGPAALAPDTILQLTIIEPAPATLQLRRQPDGGIHGELHTAGGQSRPVGHGRVQEIVEVAIPFADLGWFPQTMVAWSIHILAQGVELERLPDLGAFSFIVPDERFLAENWSV